MALISIRERGTLHAGAVASIDGQEYPIEVTDPFDAEAEGELEWYFEEHLRFPFKDQVRAERAAASIPAYGERLFRQVFADPEAFTAYRGATQGNLAALTVEIAGAPAWQRLVKSRLRWATRSRPSWST